VSGDWPVAVATLRELNQDLRIRIAGCGGFFAQIGIMAQA